MGIKLGELVIKHPLTEGELKGRVLAVDAHNMLYQFLASIRTPEGFPLMDQNGKVVSHLKGLFNRTAHLLAEGIKPVFIFDGAPHALKKGTLDLRRERKEVALAEWEDALARGDLEMARSKAQQTSRLTQEMIDEASLLLSLMGVPTFQAPGEGEAQASYMCIKGNAHATCSQDFDSLLFGTPTLIRNMAYSGRRKLPGKRVWVDVDPERISLVETLNALHLTREQLVDMAILIGTDFNEGVNGIGPKRALALLREFASLEDIVKKKRVPLLEWEEVRAIFLHPSVSDEFKLSWRDPDRRGIEEMLIDRHGFGREGVEKNLDGMCGPSTIKGQVSLDSF